jgi:hypothetical protein
LSRLDSFIARMMAQRVLLNRACAELNAAGEALKGHVIEFGLGNGRTYDHLRQHLVGRRIVVFERVVNPNPRSMPPQEDLIVGEIETTGAEFAAQHGATAALLHADLGNGVAAAESGIERWLPATSHALVRVGGLVISSTRIDQAGFMLEPLPPEVPQDRYFVYRRKE